MFPASYTHFIIHSYNPTGDTRDIWFKTRSLRAYQHRALHEIIPANNKTGIVSVM